jgi:isoaspartyl peptidase/L-asparaginase-like protein (Ntn-hydrolase superfamily)
MKKIFLALALVAAVATVAAVRRPIHVEGNTMIQRGSVVMSGDGSVTQTFATAFSSIPVVFTIQQNNAAASTTNFVNATTSNVVLRSSIAGATSVWFAVGAP